MRDPKPLIAASGEVANLGLPLSMTAHSLEAPQVRQGKLAAARRQEADAIARRDAAEAAVAALQQVHVAPGPAVMSHFILQAVIAASENLNIAPLFYLKLGPQHATSADRVLC